MSSRALARYSRDILGEDYVRKTQVERRPTCVQLDRMDYLIRALVRKDPGDGTPVRTTWPQLAKAIGFPVMGMSVREIKGQFGTRVERTMRYLIGAGYVTGWEVAYQGAEPTGILVQLPQGVAEQVRRSSSAGRAPVL